MDAPKHHPIFCIMPPNERSLPAFKSREQWLQSGYLISPVPAFMTTNTDKPSLEDACCRSHLLCISEFLKTQATHMVVLEDDAILDPKPEWTGFNFDVFIPFWDNRYDSPYEHDPKQIIEDEIPQDGTFAMLLSRRVVNVWASLLNSRAVADVSLRRLIVINTHWKIASYAGNVVRHDHDATSFIDDGRRQRFSQSKRRTGGLPPANEHRRLGR